MSVNTNISDLFFNTDVSHAARHDKKGQFECFDRKVMLEEASIFRSCLMALGITRCNVPTAEELVDDFLARV